MAKKLTILISAVLTLILLGLAGYYFLGNKEGAENGGIVSTFKNFFPFGGSDFNPETGNNTDNENRGEENNNETESQEFTKKLRKISSEPISGSGVTDIKAGSVIRYIEKATGHIYEVELFSPKKERISNTTIPLSYDAIWGNKNNSFVARYLDDNDYTIDTYSFTIKNVSTSTENKLSGVTFPERITDISTLGNSVFYLQKNTIGSSGFIIGFDGARSKKIWDSSLNELTSQYVNDRTVTLNTKPHESVPGYLYSVDTSTGEIRKILGNILGLTSVSNSDLSKVIYSSFDSVARLFLYDVKNKESKEINYQTFPEKCVWSKKDKNVAFCAIPDSPLSANTMTQWYRGLVSLSDTIRKFDFEKGAFTEVSGLNEESGESIDVVKPILSDSEQYLIFVNKKDNSLWSLDLSK